MKKNAVEACDVAPINCNIVEADLSREEQISQDIHYVANYSIVFKK
jgi:hypothetical protein